MTVTETVPAWWLGKHPEKRWIIASYTSEFAAGFGRRNRLKCLEHNPEIFPGFELRDTPCNNTEFQTTKGGGVYCVGLTAGITGHPAECFIIDDPIKTRAEADSPTIKDNIWGEYLSSVKTRLHPGSKLICIQTRWAEDDLFGRVAKEEKNVEIPSNVNAVIIMNKLLTSDEDVTIGGNSTIQVGDIIILSNPGEESSEELEGHLTYIDTSLNETIIVNKEDEIVIRAADTMNGIHLSTGIQIVVKRL